MKTHARSIKKAFCKLTSTLSLSVLTLLTVGASVTHAAYVDGEETLAEIVVYDRGDSYALSSILDTYWGSLEFRLKYDLSNYGLPVLPGAGTPDLPPEKPADECDKFVRMAQAVSSKMRDLNKFLKDQKVNPVLRTGVFEKITSDMTLGDPGRFMGSVDLVLRPATFGGGIDREDYNTVIRPGVEDRVQSEADTRDLGDRAQRMLEALAECKASQKK